MQQQMNCVLAAVLLSHCVAVAQGYSVKIFPGGLAALAGDFPQTQTFATNAGSGSKVWSNVNGGKAYMQNFPPHYITPATQLTSPHDLLLPKDSQVQYVCAKGNGPCEVSVFVYECAPCEAKKGGLLQYLVVNGFERTRCAPTFTTGKVGGIHHKTTAYVKSIDEDETATITVPGDVEFVVFGLSNGGKAKCSTLVQPACEDDTAGRCVSLMGCELAKCVQVGPSGGCNEDTCAKKEIN